MPEDKKEEMKLDHRTDCPSHDRVSSWYRAGAVTVHDKIMNWLCCLACDTASWSRTLKHYLSALDMKMWSNWNLRVTSHYSHPCFHFHKKKKKAGCAPGYTTRKNLGRTYHLVKMRTGHPADIQTVPEAVWSFTVNWCRRADSEGRTHSRKSGDTASPSVICLSWFNPQK